MDVNALALIFGIFGTLFGGYQAYRIWRDKTPKLELSLDIKWNLSIIPGIGSAGGNVVVDLVIKNVGHRTVFIESVGIEFPNEVIYKSLQHLNRFPLEMRPEQSETFVFKAMDLLSKLDEAGFKVEKEISGIAIDTLTRKYKSSSVLFNFNEVKLSQQVLDKRDF